MRKILFNLILLFQILEANDSDFFSYRKDIANFYYEFLDTSTSFLYDKSNLDYIKKHNHLRFYLNTSIDKNHKISLSPSLRASIKLPKISKNLYLTVEKESKVTDNPNEIETPTTKEAKNSRVGLKYFFKRENNFSLFTKLGGRPTASWDKIYIEGGVEKLYQYKKHYFFTYLHHDYYFKNKISVSNIGLDYKQKLDNRFSFLQNNNLTIEDKQKTTLDNSFILEQYVSKKVNYSYWITFYSVKDSDFKLHSLSYNFKYHRALKKWLFVDVIPSLVKNYHDKNNFDKYLYINFGMIF